jgi:hypothetical protein
VYCTDRRSYYRYLLFVPGTEPACRRYGITLDWSISNGRYKKVPYRSFNSVRSTLQTNRKKRPLEELAREFDMIFPV